MLQGGEAGPLGREALGRDGRLRVPACGLPLLSSLPREGREQPRGSSGGCEGAGARPGVHRGRQSAATSPSPATATGGSRNSFHLAEQTWSSDALSISAPAHGHHRLTVFMLVASWPEVAATARGITPLHCRLKQKEVGGGRGRRFPEAPRQIPPQTPLRRPGPRATLASGAGEANVWLGRPARPSPAEAGTGTVASDKIGVHLGGKWKGRLWGRLLTCLPQ